MHALCECVSYMQITYPKDIHDQIASSVDDGRWSLALNTIQVLPELLNEERTHQILTGLLRSNVFACRLQSAALLDRHGDRNGSKHLVYNAVKNHPLYGYEQNSLAHTRASRASLIQCIGPLDDEDISLLVSDTSRLDGNVHIEVLAIKSGDGLASHIANLLSYNQRSAVQAACVLAVHGDDGGIKELIRGFEESILIEVAAVGLSHLEDDRIIPLFERLIAEKSEHYKSVEFGLIFVSELLQRMHIVKARQLPSVGDTFEYYYRFPVNDIFNRHALRDCLPTLSALDLYIYDESRVNTLWMDYWANNSRRPIDFVLTGAGYLAEFADDTTKINCASRQRSAVELLLKYFGSRYNEILDSKRGILLGKFFDGIPLLPEQATGIYIDGVHIEISADDFIRAATSWIENPIEHCRGFYTRCFSQ